MKRAAAVAALAVALGLAAVAGTAWTARSGHGILFLRTPANNARVQQLFVWQAGASPRQIGPSSDWILTPRWSPSGTAIAFADERGGWDDPDSTEIYVVDADGSHLRRVAFDVERSNVYRDEAPSWSPDGKQIAFVRETSNSPYEELVTVNVATGRQKVLPASGESLLYGGPAWGRAGIAYAAGQGRVMLVKPGGGGPRLFARVSSNVLAWSPNGGRLAALEHDRVVLFSGAGRQVGEIRTPFRRRTHTCGIAWSPDGKRLLVGTAHDQVGLWTVPVKGGRWQRLPVSLTGGTIDSCGVSWR